MHTFFIADTHFGHEAIIRYENRPFQTVKEMDDAMMENWNTVVKKEDKVYLLGDISFYNAEKTERINYTPIQFEEMLHKMEIEEK